MGIFNFFRKGKPQIDDHIVKIKLESFIIDGVKMDPKIDTAEIFLDSGARIIAIGILLHHYNSFKKGDFIRTPSIEKIINEEGQIILKAKNNCYFVQN